jgi:DNA sulfur modification protein DndB
MMSTLLLPGLSGTFSNWTYFQVMFTVNDLVDRVKSVEEVEIIHSGKVSNMLQRAFDPKRLEPITQYLLNQTDSYVNNMTVAIFGGNPEWLNIDIKSTMLESEMEQEMLDTISDNIGLVKLDGQETLFVLDGQHRLKALRVALEEKPEIGAEQISVTIIGHLNTDDGIKRTRRLFTTINRYAKPVSEGENILLDEDDASAILVRKLIEYYPKFTYHDATGKPNSIIAFNKTANLKSSDKDKFTTVISLWNVNELILDNDSLYPYKIRRNYVRIRPTDEVI